MQPNYLGKNLIFIISQPRSGSTLLQRVLAGHPDIQTSAETWLMLHPIYGKKRNKIESEYGGNWTYDAVHEFLQNYTADGAKVYDDAIRAWAQVIYSAAINFGGKKLFLDKTPRYFFIIPDLYRIFPKAKFIFLLRNPMAVLSSELRTYVKDKWTILSLFRPDLLDAPRLILEGIRELGDNAITVRYEDFVSEPEIELEKLCGHLEIEYHESILDYEDTPAPVGIMNDPIGIHKHKRPNAAGVDKWKKLADSSQHQHFALSYLKDLGPEIIEGMGYCYEGIHSSLINNPPNTKNLFPWKLAITPEKQLRYKERLFLQRYFLKAQYGSAKGNIMFVSKQLSSLLKKLISNIVK